MKLRHIILASIILLFVTSALRAQWISTTDAFFPQYNGTRSLMVTGSEVWAGTGSGVWRTIDAGQHWDTLNQGLAPNGGPYGGLAMTSFAGNLLLSNPAPYISTNSGANWAIDTFGMGGQQIFAFGAIGNTLFAGGYNLFRSDDAGMHWKAVQNAGLPYQPYIRSFVTKGSILFLTSTMGTFRSIDSGKSWTECDNGMGTGGANGLLSVGDRLLAASGVGIYLSTNNGDTWTLASTNAIGFGPLASGNGLLFAGAQNAGVYVSRDNGSSWSVANTGIEKDRVDGLTVAGDYLFAAVNGNYHFGVYRRPLADFQNASIDFDREQQYSISPNPAINFVTVSQAGHVTVTNMLGISVLDVTNHDRSDMTLNVSKLPAGTYFVRSDGSRAMQKLIKQ